ncbi:MAG: ribonuclease E/G [Eubacterium sp.]|nr:ribonuclease E/G [Eubacterium sp.]
MKKLLITSEQLTDPVSQKTAVYKVCTFYEGSRMIEAELRRADAETILNNIYIARVKNVVANLNAAFVEIAKGTVCYLPLEALRQPIFTKKLSKQPIAAGEELAVQVTKEAVKTKDAVVTANLSFSGEYLVLTSANLRTGISSKISGQDRVRLQELAQKLRKEYGGTESDFGLILRTNAAHAEESAICAEFLQLQAEYEALRRYAASRTAYTCLRREQPFYLKMLTDADKSDLEEVVTDEEAVFEELKAAVSGGLSIRLYQDKLLSLASLYNIAGQISAALKQKVWMKSGANLVIEPTEALTVIDVNSGKNTEKKDKQRNHYKINLEAAEEIAFQLRLRNLSGIILVDFIDMQSKDDQEGLMAQLRAYLRLDPVPAQVVDMTRLGLVEITRKKKKKPLAEQI